MFSRATHHLHVFPRCTSVAYFPALDRQVRFPLLPNLEILGSLQDDEDNGKDIVKQIVGHCKVIVTCIMLPK